MEDALVKQEQLLKKVLFLEGGTALLRCQKVLDELELEGEEQVGVEIMKRTLEEPIRK